MKVDEVREIKERIYEHTKNFTFEELRDYYAKSTDKAEKLIAEIRKKKGLNIKINE
ncbi:MAG: hypothetical protein FWG49_00290 [Leptospirales bacterium]|nr:hypothetical protein [Leptospirales bacterium]